MQAFRLRGAPAAGATFICAIVLALAGAGTAQAQAQDIPAAGAACDESSGTWQKRVLAFGKTAGARNEAAITAARGAICETAGGAGIAVDYSEDANALQQHLAGYDAVVFLHNTGDILTDAQQTALESYVREGKGVAAIGAAGEAEPSWPFWGTLIGSRVGARTSAQPATVEVYDPANPSTRSLPRQWRITDQWYTLASNPRGNVHVLAGLDETTYDAGAGAMGRDHPIAWCRDIDAGRSWYSGLGHEADLYATQDIRRHLLGGVQTAIGGPDVECGATIWRNFQKTLLTREVGEPMDIAVMPDRRVLMTDRRGRLRLYDPADGTISLAAELQVYAGEEDGLQTVALDPDFATNNWVYLYYSR
jgi:cytochrome c